MKRSRNQTRRESLWRDYCSAIMEGGYEDVPTRTGFRLFLAARGVPETVADGPLSDAMETAREDVVLAGAMLKHYQSTPAMTVLKTAPERDSVPVPGAPVFTAAEVERMVLCDQGNGD